MFEGILFPRLLVFVFKNVWQKSMMKNCHSGSLFSVVSKVFEKLINNRFLEHLEKYGLFSDSQYGCRSSRSTADLLKVYLVQRLGFLTGLLKL